MERVRKHKVYGWNGYRADCPSALNGSQQTREICAATSVKKLCEILGCTKSELLCLSETGNELEVQIAMKEPGVVFWRSNSIIGKATAESWTRSTKRY